MEGIDMYTIGVIGLITMFALVIILLVMLIKDQAKVSYRQQALEERTSRELESFRERVKSLERRERNDWSGND